MAAGHAGLQLSFGSTGDCFDNAAMETFWATLKREIAHIRGSSGRRGTFRCVDRAQSCLCPNAAPE